MLKGYKITGIEPGKYDFFGFGAIDLTKITDADAEVLVMRGFKYLEKAKSEVKDSKTDKEAKK
jgi:hypothetical protein